MLIICWVSCNSITFVILFWNDSASIKWHYLGPQYGGNTRVIQLYEILVHFRVKLLAVKPWLKDDSARFQCLKTFINTQKNLIPQLLKKIDIVNLEHKCSTMSVLISTIQQKPVLQSHFLEIHQGCSWRVTFPKELYPWRRGHSQSTRWKSWPASSSNTQNSELSQKAWFCCTRTIQWSHLSGLKLPWEGRAMNHHRCTYY